MRTSLTPILAAAAFAVATTLGFAGTASAATLPECGAFNFGAETNCEMVVSGGCTAKCEPINFTAQCTAELYVGCEGGCNVMIDAGCTASCQADCSAQCTVDPGSFECSGGCQADCGASCTAQCSAATDKAKCDSQCKATCGIDCDAKCKATPPSADCMAKCSASCDGSCHAQANMDCQLQCQAKGSLDCETKLTGGCQADCQKPEGALFCDGQYVDVGDQLESCANALKDAFQVEIKGYYYGEAQCSGTSCSAEAGAGCSCNAAGHEDSPSNALGILGALAAFGLAFGRRKK